MNRTSKFCSLLIPFILTTAALTTFSADPKEPAQVKPYTPTVRDASREGEDALKRFQIDKGIKIELWAAEPMLANPVAFCFDEKGRCYVAETFRHSAGVTDNRGKPWLEDELASRTVEDRVNVYKKYAKNDFEKVYEKERDRVRLIEDTTGSGRADKASVFRDDFGKAEDGIGSGLLARHGDVFFTNIPSLYKLKDTKGTGTADVKETLSTGYGVHVAFIGHDLHGLRLGPDGKLYFTIGDRGLNVKTKEGKHLFYPDTGAVLRCDLDGANLEVIHKGLRNPQELAFDDYGNLFTVDNNSDSGDKARFVYVVEGGDTGWRIGYQYGSSMHDSTVKQGNRGPWNYEKIWHPFHEGQPAYIVPTFNNFSDGPSGFCHYPGLGLSDDYKNHFFLCDFRGGANGSGVWSFTTKPRGAGFELANPKHFVWSILCTDCDFGPDSAFYISDWTEGWNKPGKGRIYKVTDPDAQKNPAVQDARVLLADGFQKQNNKDLAALLGHPHQQVRLEAQLALAAKGKDAIELFSLAAQHSEKKLARIHGIWGLAIVGRKDIAAYEPLVALLKDSDAEIRAQAAKSLGANRPLSATEALVKLLSDAEPRVAFMAAQSLALTPPASGEDAKKVHLVGIDAIIKRAQANADQDPYLRHALGRALAGMLGGNLNCSAHLDPSASVRMVALLAWRRTFEGYAEDAPLMGGTLATSFLSDTDPKIVAEASRAVHDLKLKDALPKLAALTARPELPATVLYRALNAHFLLGKPENAAALAAFAARPDAPASLRVVALQMLGSWATPPRRDFITGLTQKLPTRDAAIASGALKTRLGGIFAGPAAVQKEAASVASKLGITEVGPFLFTLATDGKAAPISRKEALDALDALRDARLPEAVSFAIGSEDASLRNAGRAILLKSKPAEVLQQLKEVLAKDNTVEKQGALALLSSIKSPEADVLLEAWLDKLLKKEAPGELQLDILDAAGKRESASIKVRLKKFDESRSKVDPLALWNETLLGGDAARGRDLFINKSAVSCQRCHKLDGEGGEVGPPLNGLAAKQKRDYLLESLVLPNKQIAKGYESILITKTDGKTVSGILKSEDAKEVKLMTIEGQLLMIKKDDIEDRRATKTGMPEDLAQKLTKQEIRDLVEFLAGLKEEWKK